MPTQAEMRVRLRQQRAQETTFPGSDLSRWRALPADRTDMSKGWRVVAEAGHAAPEPNHFPGHDKAQRRADDLNRDEQYAVIGAAPPRR